MSNPVSAPKSVSTIIVVTALMLFSMFFGAGNLIFPPVLGVNAGTNFWPAIIGFLLAGVALPVIGIVAIALSGHSVRDLAGRAGRVFGLIFPILAYLSIGAFYALPRTGAVAFETAYTPLGGSSSMLSSAVFNLVFFGIALALSWNPNTIASSLGRVLTPALVILLAVLITISMLRFDTIERPALEPYDAAAMSSGLLAGYLTMDAIAALAFGIVVISTLRYNGLTEGKQLVSGTIIAGVGAGVLLAAIYVGLGIIGQVLPTATDHENGAGILADAANTTMGFGGQIVFSAIVVLACMTTAVGLITSTSEFFTTMLPGVKYHAWAVLFTVMSISMATLGLDTVLAVAAPIIGFIYPPAITLMFLALFEPAVGGKMSFNWAFRIGIWVSVVWSALTTFVSLGWGASVIEPLINWSPMQAESLGWLLPTVVGVVVGLVLDVTTRNKATAVPADPAPVS
ncbi:branched-chain amino acid transport system II carrier protein [Corynebacterium uterequi]|uniref:Branched-chain amino acid uptake carrier n=1 Tax=Corynebacterium uterequi TaxID=1072256 RepID=A0A0G3HE09_9CORY|nr:branched-chain amino acid transport system II carrier protein [Corynebacterium uterequi]AKK11601.1 branched-chain amino acid uptake carrier [Corynebacterium uterequi]